MPGGMKAGLISNSSNIIGRLTQAVLNTPAYCDRKAPLYFFFADRPLFRMALMRLPSVPLPCRLKTQAMHRHWQDQ